MSWSEVKKINSDFAREPLNFNNYINDMSMFGSRSYVLDVENSSLWRDLIVNSLAMFGHDAIHETVYNRFTDEDVDYMIRNNGQLGQSFNSFYGVTNFTAGRIDTVLGTLDVDAYSVLEPKFKSGIYRYISENTADENAGKWLGTIYNNDELKAKTDIASIVSDVDLWTRVIMNNPSMRRVISLSETTVQWFATNYSEVYTDFINEVCHNTNATMTLFTSLSLVDGLETFMNTESAVSVMANNEESMIAVTFMIEPFAAMIASEVAMTAVANSEVAINVIISSITNVTNSEKVLTGINTNLTAIENTLPNIADTEPNIAEVEEVKTHISEVLNSLATVSSQTNVLINNIHSLLDSSTAMTAIANSSIAMTAITEDTTLFSVVMNNSTSSKVVANSSIAMKIIANNTTVMNNILNNADWRNIVNSSTIGFAEIANNPTAFNTVTANSTWRSEILQSASAMKALVNSANGMSRAANYSNLLSGMCSSSIAMNALAKSTLDWSSKKEFFVKLNSSSTYRKNARVSVINTSYFTKIIGTASDKVSNCDQYGTSDYAYNSIILCCLGYYESTSAKTNLYINGDLIRSGADYSEPTSVPSSYPTIAIPTATFTETGDGYVAVEVYRAI